MTADPPRLMSRAAVERVRFAFYDQVTVTRFVDFIKDLDLTSAERTALLDLAKRERWNDEHASFSDALRRLTEEKLAQHFHRLSLGSVRTGRQKMITAAEFALKRARQVTEQGLAATAALGQRERTHAGKALIAREQLGLLKSFTNVTKDCQQIWAGALGLSDALTAQLPLDVDLTTTSASPELAAAIKDMQKIAEDLRRWDAVDPARTTN